MNDKIFNLILEERKRQDEKHGKNSHSPTLWLSIMTEEVGETARAINEFSFDCNNKIQQIEQVNNIQKELIQVLAVGFAMHNDLEKIKNKE